MKVALALVILGIVGLGQYAYFQFTPLAYKYEYYTYQMPGVPYDMVGVNVIRDWTAGVIGLAIGVILLGIGVYRFRQQRTH